MATKVEPWMVLERVVQIYRAQAAVLLPMSLAVAAFIAATTRATPAAALASGVGELAFGALFAGAASQLAHATLQPGAGRSARVLARAAARALPPALVLVLAEGLLVGIGAIALLSVFVTTLLGTSTADIAANAAVGVLMLMLGLALAIRWAVAVPVAVIERRGVGASFHRSWRLVRGRGWRVLGAVALVWVPLLLLALLANDLLAGSGPTARSIVLGPLHTFTWPMAALTPPVLYHALIDAAPAAAGQPDAPSGDPAPMPS